VHKIPARWERPLDASTSLATRSLADRLARAVSVACAPPVMVLPVAGLASWHVAAGEPVLASAITLVVTTALLPTLFVYAAYLAGLISSPDLPRRAERLQPALFTTVCAVGAYPLLRGVGAPPLFLTLDTALALQMALLAIVTIWWKISYHAAGAAGLAVVALALGDPSVALPLAALPVLVGWARVRLGRHTPYQVAAGWLSALPALLILWWTWPA
jgi:membrane-associated phospholipid phosphatase